MVVFVPGDRTKVLHVREETTQKEDLEQEDVTKIYELIIFTISVEEAINDAVSNSTDTIDRVLDLINKNTIRKGDEFLGGF